MAVYLVRTRDTLPRDRPTVYDDASSIILHKLRFSNLVADWVGGSRLLQQYLCCWAHFCREGLILNCLCRRGSSRLCKISVSALWFVMDSGFSSVPAGKSTVWNETMCVVASIAECNTTILAEGVAVRLATNKHASHWAACSVLALVWQA